MIMRIRDPRTTALIFSSGKMVCTGAKRQVLVCMSVVLCCMEGSVALVIQVHIFVVGVQETSELFLIHKIVT